MITVRNHTNQDEYSILFKKATEVLRDQGSINETDSITSLQQYFKYLTDLVHGKGYTGENPSSSLQRLEFAQLPLDEEYFTIDANTRLITVPPTFRQNGISVQGDEGAETVFFRINRFFDYTDLLDTSIFIQWEAADGTSDVSAAWNKQVDVLKPEWISFGWVLDNRITKAAGVVKFSVRFVSLNNEEKVIQYSFNTLTAQVAINPSLNFEFDKLKPNDSIYINALKRIKSSITGVISGAAQPPIFLKPDPTDDLQIDILDLIQYDEINRQYYNYIEAQAETTTGEVIYNWYKEPDSNTYLTNHKTVFRVITSSEFNNPNEKKTYYASKGNDIYETLTYVKGTGFINSQQEVISEGNVYEKLQQLKVTEIGQYGLKAQTKLVENNSAEVPATHKWKVKGPSNISFIKDKNNNITNEDNTYIFTKNADGIYETTIKTKIDNYDDYQEVKIQWKLNDKSIGDEQLISGINWKNTLGIIKHDIRLELSTNPEELQGLQGDFQVIVTGYKNNAATSDTTSCKYRILLPTMVPNIDPILLENNVLKTQVSYINNYQPQACQKTLYQWYKYKTEENVNTDDVTKDVNDAKNGVYTPSDIDIQITGATSETYKPEESGSYFCMITNYLLDTNNNIIESSKITKSTEIFSYTKS